MLTARSKTPTGESGGKVAGGVDVGQSVPEAPNPNWTALATVVQTESTVSAPSDPLEREADRVARHVVEMPAASARVGQSPPSVYSRSTSEGGDLIDSPGTPLDATSRQFFEPRFGRDFSQVRLHTDANADHLSHALNANALAVASHIAFRSGHYVPGSAHGRQLLAHELAHVVQQGHAPALGDPASATPARSSVRVVSRDATNQSITPDYAAGLDDGALLSEMQAVDAVLRNTKSSDETHQILTANLSVLRADYTKRNPGANALSEDVQPPVSLPSINEIPEGGTNVGKVGVVGWDGEPELRLRTSPDTSAVNIVRTLPFSTRLQVIKSFAGDWLFVSTPTGEMGYVAAQYVRTDLPEPNARLHRVVAGVSGTAIGIAERYYKEYANDWGQDLRFYVNVLAWANKISVPDAYWGWRQVHFQAGQLIWVPSQRFAYSLKGTVNSGSLSWNIADAVGLAGIIERIAQIWDDFNKALDYSEQFKAEAMARRIEQTAQGLVEGLITMIKLAVAILAISTAIGAILGGVFGVGAGAAPGAAAGFEVGMVILEWLGLGMLVMWIAESLVQLGAAFGDFLGSVWNARGDDKKLQLAGYKWADAIALMIAKLLEGLLMLVMARGLPAGLKALRGTRLGRAMGESRAAKWLSDRAAKVQSGESPIPGPEAALNRVRGTGRAGAQPASVTARGQAQAFHQLPPNRLPANLPEGHFWMRSADGTQWVLMQEAGAAPVAFELSVYSDAAGTTNYVLRGGGRVIQTDAITRSNTYNNGQRLPSSLDDTGPNNPYRDPVTGQPWDKGHGVDYADTLEGPGVLNSTTDPANFTPQASWWNRGPRNSLVARIRSGGGGYREMAIYDANPPVTANGTPIPREFVFVETNAAGAAQNAWRIPNQQGAAGRQLSSINPMQIPLANVPPVLLRPGVPLSGAGGGATAYGVGLIFGERGQDESAPGESSQ